MKKNLIVLFVGVFLGISTTLIFKKVVPILKALKVHEIGISDPGQVTNEPDDEAVVSFDRGTGIFNDFDGNDAVSWDVNDRNMRIEKVADDKCAKGNCLKVVYPKGDYPGLSSKKLPKNWDGFDTLKFDAYNTSDQVVRFGILIKDKTGGHAYPNRYDGYFAFRPGMNNFVFNITGIKTNNKKRTMNLSEIQELVIFAIEPRKETTIYFDNIRLDHALGADVKGLLRFDFGPEQSEVWPGFAQVTDSTIFNDKLGYGWKQKWGLNAQDRQYPDALLRDWIRGGVPFKVNVPSGEYVVYIMLEDPGFWEYYQNYEKRTVIAEDKIVGEEVLPSEKFFKEYYYANLDHEDLPGEDIYDNYVKKRFVWKRFVVKVNDGQLNLQVEPGYGYASTISALLVAPVEEDPKVQDYLRKLGQDEKDFFKSLFVESKVDAIGLPEEIKDKYSEKGFIPFVKDPVEEMLPLVPPRPEQIKDNISTFAYQGDKVPVVIGVYALKDIGDAEVDVSGLVGEDATIPSEEIEKNYVENKIKLSGSHVYKVKGELLRKKNKASVFDVKTRYFWLTINVPVGTKPGKYAGDILVKSNEGKIERVGLSLDVMPFSLSKPNIPIGLFYSVPFQYDWYEDMKAYKWTAIERQLSDIRAHNMNTLALGLSPDVKKIHDNGDVELDMDFYSEFLRAYNHFGFNKQISAYGMIEVYKKIKDMASGDESLFKKAFLNAFYQINGITNKLTGHDPVMILADEISNPGSPGIESIKGDSMLLEQAGLNPSAYMNQKEDIKGFSFLKTVTISDGLDLNEKLFDKARKAGVDVWFYNIGRDRFTFGYYLWKAKAKGRVEWHYQLPAVDPYFDLDGRESDFCASYPSENGPLNSVWFEQAREGIDDYRYLLTLSLLINRAKELGHPEMIDIVKDAEKVMSKVTGDVNIDLSENKWKPEQYNEHRLQVANEISRLIKALKSSGN